MMKGRDKFAIGVQVMLFVICWTMSLAGRIGAHFWDRAYYLEYYKDTENLPNDKLFEDCETTTFNQINSAYYLDYRRFLCFLPHVLGAIIWWNAYFFQLIPKVRRAFDKKIHRWLGRVLMVVAVAQVISGTGLAISSPSNVIKIVSVSLAMFITYIIYQAVTYAVARDIPRHKYWALRLVGYMNTIAFQRFYMLVLIGSHAMGWHGLYPAMAGATMEEGNKIAHSIFDDSFILSCLTAMATTEWYLAGEIGMLEVPQAHLTSQAAAVSTYDSDTISESQPILKYATH